MHRFRKKHVNLLRFQPKWPTKCTYFEVQSNTFVVQTGHNQFVRVDIFNAEPIRRKVLALCPNCQFSGQCARTPLAFEKRILKQVRIMRNGAQFVEYNTSSNTQNNSKPSFWSGRTSDRVGTLRQSFLTGLRPNFYATIELRFLICRSDWSAHICWVGSFKRPSRSTDFACTRGTVFCNKNWAH